MVILNRDTVIRGTIEIGVTVEIKARIINGVPVAKELRVIQNPVTTDTTPDDTDKTDDTAGSTSDGKLETDTKTDLRYGVNSNRS